MIGGGSGCGDWGGVSTGDGSKMGRHKSYLKYVQNGGGGVKATFGQCPKARRFFPRVSSLRKAIPGKMISFLNIAQRAQLSMSKSKC